MLLLVLIPCQGHMNLVIPTPRNAQDGGLAEFQGGKSPTTSCTCANAKECDMGVRKEGGSGQPCLWWSQGSNQDLEMEYAAVSAHQAFAQDAVREQAPESAGGARGSGTGGRPPFFRKSSSAAFAFQAIR